MGLEIFQKPGKVEEEKPLETVKTKEAEMDKSLLEILDYCKPPLLNRFNPKRSPTSSWKGDFKYYLKELMDIRVEPNVVKRVKEELQQIKLMDYERMIRGNLISALIQISYDQGFNYFQFGVINDSLFGSFLEGNKDNEMMIETKIVSGNSILMDATHVRLKTKVLDTEHGTLNTANFCSLEAMIMPKTKKFGLFGGNMMNCQIYSPNKALIEKLKRESHADETNRFILGRMPE